MTLLDTALDTPVALRTGRRFTTADVAAMSASFEGCHPSEVIGWAVEEFGSRLSLSASFADTLLIDLAVKVEPDIEVVFIDTGFHFAETLATARRAMARYALNLTVLRPLPTAADVWTHGVDTCCGSRKVAPLERHLVANADAWMSGLRRDDGPQRADAPIVDLDLRGLVKVNPLAAWSTPDVERYILENDVLINPLTFEGYPSIGCWPCTDPADPTDPRAGRWSGSAKTECGLHA
ncbi:MAG: putative phosphoadenosine phosphosulfate reductase [Acidimicrobiales bacterium]|nr:MAG: putative phosphoadenosine phosphosulfate reductase [Acidimicrobiales bacterium]